MNESKTSKEIAALRAAALEDLLVTSDTELLLEALESGEDIKAVTDQMKSAMRETASAALRQRIARAKERMRTTPMARPARPALGRIKQIVQEVFQQDRSLGLAFRDGKRQSDADWQSLYDDLVTLGAIKPDDDVG